MMLVEKGIENSYLRKEVDTRKNVFSNRIVGMLYGLHYVK